MLFNAIMRPENEDSQSVVEKGYTIQKNKVPILSVNIFLTDFLKIINF